MYKQAVFNSVRLPVRSGYKTLLIGSIWDHTDHYIPVAPSATDSSGGGRWTKTRAVAPYDF